MLKFTPNEKFMKIAIREAKLAHKRGDYPIGACIVQNNKVIAFGWNRVKTKRDSTKHVELELIQYVVWMHPGHYIEDCILYTTHEPCPMCSWASARSKLGGIVFGNYISDFKEHNNVDNYFKWRIIDISCEEVLKNENIKIYGWFMNKECKELFKLAPWKIV